VENQFPVSVANGEGVVAAPEERFVRRAAGSTVTSNSESACLLTVPCRHERSRLHLHSPPYDYFPRRGLRNQSVTSRLGLAVCFRLS
jgi:hypothetical protein